MTKKEAITKCISEMNTDKLSELLDDNKSYMDVPKETFINKLNEKFNTLRSQGINNFSKILKGHCGGHCNNGCGGYTFLTNDNQSLDLLVEEENEEIKDLYTCTTFINDERIENKKEISIFIYEDEKTDFIPTEEYIESKIQIETAFNEFNQFKNVVTPIEEFCKWSLGVKIINKKINIWDAMHLKFISPILKLQNSNSKLQKLITFHDFAKKAMQKFNKLNLSNEKELLIWSLKYAKKELVNNNYNKMKGKEQNGLVLHSMDNSVVLDCTKYTESLQFFEIHSKYYWEFNEKYKIHDLFEEKTSEPSFKKLEFKPRIVEKTSNEMRQVTFRRKRE